MIIPKGIITNLQKTSTVICFTFSFFIVASISNAQTLTFLGGVSLPTSLYANTDFTLEAPGTAKTGYMVSGVFDYNQRSRIINPFIQFSFNSNNINDEAWDKYYHSIAPKYTALIAFSPWTQNIILLGPRFNYFGDNFDMFLKAGLGMAWLKSYGYTLTDTAAKISIKYNVLSTNALAFSFGLGSNIYINSGLSICIGYEFLYANADYGYEKYTDSNGNIIPAKLKVKNDIALSTGTFYAGLRFHMKRNKEKNKFILN
ncbi:MAG: hypothetical protein H7296_05215 [Bacteroidia bacterium]|nr:hypothetical protein [Bacteroidia bacterium]